MPRPKLPHLYSRTFRTKAGVKRTLRYVRFRTWQGNLLVDPAGDNEGYGDQAPRPAPQD
jgi:hypothetical protein